MIDNTRVHNLVFFSKSGICNEGTFLKTPFITYFSLSMANEPEELGENE